MKYWWAVITLANLIASTWGQSTLRPYYTAAVFEHNRFGTTNDSAEAIIGTNLAIYKKAAQIAKSKGSDIIVFPEYGIFQYEERSKIKPFMEAIPDPLHPVRRANPCEEHGPFLDRPILRTLSCIAKDYGIFVVANMGDIQNCSANHDCPEDGTHHFNANVVFDRNGTLVLKYHKEHLFFELGFDLPRRRQMPVFRTDFGTFATFTSFDMMFPRMGKVSRFVDAVVLPTMWVELTPQMTSVQLFQSWAIGNNCTLIATNVNIPGYFAVGSGIFHGTDGALAYSYNPDGTGKLVIARVPKRGYPAGMVNASKVIAVARDRAWHWRQDGKHVKAECSRKLLDDADKIHQEYRCVEENVSNYTFVKLSKSSDHVEACDNGMCCTLDYTAAKLSDSFYLGVYNGTQNLFDRYFLAEENCLLVRCEPLGDKPCATFPRKSKTTFHQIQIEANISTRHVYPSFLGSSMRLVHKSEWKFDLRKNTARIRFKSQVGKKVISVGFKGRCYNRDPPYIR